jgi:hypothetical protein
MSYIVFEGLNVAVVVQVKQRVSEDDVDDVIDVNEPCRTQRRMCGRRFSDGDYGRRALHMENPETLVGSKEVCNLKVKQRMEHPEDLTPAEKLLEELQEDDNWAASCTTGDNSHINYLFFAYKPAIKLAQLSPELLLADSTY